MLFTAAILTLQFTFSANTDPMCQYGGTFSTKNVVCQCIPVLMRKLGPAVNSSVEFCPVCQAINRIKNWLEAQWLANFASNDCTSGYSQLGSEPDPLECTVLDESQWKQVNCTSRQKFQCLYSTDNPCQNGWYQIGSSCFVVNSSNEPITWTQAEYHCTSNYSELGSFLTSIHDNENELILTLSKTFTSTTETDIWIGLYREDQYNFKWADGTGVVCDVWCNDLPKDVEWRCGSVSLTD